MVVRLESSYPPLPRVTDAYITLRNAARPNAPIRLSGDSLPAGIYRSPALEPGTYAVQLLRIGFKRIDDTVHLQGVQTDSALYHAAVDIVCLTSAPSF
jgi:hypothetical protein